MKLIVFYWFVSGKSLNYIDFTFKCIKMHWCLLIFHWKSELFYWFFIENNWNWFMFHWKSLFYWFSLKFIEIYRFVHWKALCLLILQWQSLKYNDFSLKNIEIHFCLLILPLDFIVFYWISIENHWNILICHWN